jgi:galactonate dehydratase
MPESEPTPETTSASLHAAAPLNLKITDVRTFVVDTGSDENFVFVKIYTNAGITGLGEATLTGVAATVAQAILEFRDFLIGQNPADIELLWQNMYRGPRYRGGLVMGTVISGIEIALWDILGQALGQPIWQLLGGRAREKVRIYPHTHSFDGKRLGGDGQIVEYAEWDGREDQVLAWTRVKEAGWTACKAGFLPTHKGFIDPRRTIDRGIDHLREVREAVGPDFDILIDVHGKATVPMAVEFCNRAEEFRPLFLEEATQPESIEELEHLRRHTNAPLATGERFVTKHAFARICAERLVDYVQPDVIHCGGILETWKIAALADAFGIQAALHNPQSLVSTMASLHVCMAAPNVVLLEIGSGSETFGHELFDGCNIRLQGGYALPPDGPGLGVTLNEAIAAKRPYEAKGWKVVKFADGTIGNH